MQLWAERQGKLSAPMPWRGGNHEKIWRSRNFYHENFQSWDFQQFHKNSEPQKFGAIRYLFRYPSLCGINSKVMTSI